LDFGFAFASISANLIQLVFSKESIQIETIKPKNRPIQNLKSKIQNGDVMDMFTRLANDALWLILILSLLPLLASLIVGLVVSLFQALTQIQEQTLTFVPKIIATILVIMITAGWMMDTLREFAVKAFDLMLQISVMR
jgi:flagellar biosynthetic protein FliQ